MDYQERTRIATPEGLDIDLELAGIGSRLAAWLLDSIIQVIAIGLIELGLFSGIEDSVSGAFVAVVGTIAAFAVIWGYHVVFETFRDGQTPGKSRLGIRVRDSEGGPVLFREAAVRNLIRPIDEWLTAFLGALISIVRSRRNQRIGDHAAGTLVIRDPTEPVESARTDLLFSEATWRLVDQASSWDTTQLSAEEFAAARQFLARRKELPAQKRQELALQLAAALRAKVPGADPGLPPERLIEALVALRSIRS